MPNLIHSYHSSLCRPFEWKGGTQGDGKIYLGVEIETEPRPGRCSSELRPVLEDYAYLFRYERDGSLNADGVEFVSDPCTLDYWKTVDLKDFCQRVLNAGYRSHNTRRCGMHVHISADTFTSGELARVDAIVNKHQNFFEKIGRRRNGHYYQYCPNARVRHFASHAGHHYCSVNFEHVYFPQVSKRTCREKGLADGHFEIRLAKGTLSWETILATLELYEALTGFAKEASWSDILKGQAIGPFVAYMTRPENRARYALAIDYVAFRTQHPVATKWAMEETARKRKKAEREAVNNTNNNDKQGGCECA